MANWYPLISMVVILILKEIPGCVLMKKSENRSHFWPYVWISLSIFLSFPNYIRQKIFENSPSHCFTYITVAAHFFNCLIVTLLVFFTWEDFFLQYSFWFGLVNLVFIILYFFFDLKKKKLRWYLFFKDTFLNSPLFKLSIIPSLLTSFLPALENFFLIIQYFIQITKLWSLFYNIFSSIEMLISGYYYFHIIGENDAPRMSEADYEDLNYNSPYDEFFFYLKQYNSLQSDSKQIKKTKKRMYAIYLELYKFRNDTKLSMPIHIKQLWKNFHKALNLIIHHIIDEEFDSQIFTEYYDHLVDEHNYLMKRLYKLQKDKNFDERNEESDENEEKVPPDYMELRKLKDIEMMLSTHPVQPIYVIMKFTNEQYTIPYNDFKSNIQYLNFPLPLLNKNYKYREYVLHLGKNSFSGLLEYVVGSN